MLPLDLVHGPGSRRQVSILRVSELSEEGCEGVGRQSLHVGVQIASPPTDRLCESHQHGVAATLSWLDAGLTQAMNQFNGLSYAVPEGNAEEPGARLPKESEGNPPSPKEGER